MAIYNSYVTMLNYQRVCIQDHPGVLTFSERVSCKNSKMFHFPIFATLRHAVFQEERCIKPHHVQCGALTQVIKPHLQFFLFLPQSRSLAKFSTKFCETME